MTESETVVVIEKESGSERRDLRPGEKTVAKSDDMKVTVLAADPED